MGKNFKIENNNFIKVYQNLSHKEVIERSKKILSKDKSDWRIYNILCSSLLALDKNEDAKKFINEALEKFQDIPNLYRCLGIYYSNKNDYINSKTQFIKAIKINKNYYEAYIDLYKLYEKTKKNNNLLEISKYLVVKFNNNHLSFFYHALSLEKNSKKKEAIEFYKKSIVMRPSHVDSYNNLGLIYKDLLLMKDSIKIFEEVYKIKECDDNTKYNYAKLLSKVGEEEKAEKIIRDIIKNKFNLSKSYNLLARVKKIKEGDEDFLIINKLFNKLKNDSNEKVILGLNIAKALENSKNFNEASSYFIKANGIKKNNLKYDVESHLNQFKKIKELFTPDFKEKYYGKGYKSKKNIFIVGMPRSGSSLIEQILSSHSKVTGLGELHEMITILNKKNKNLRSLNQLKNVSLDYFNEIGEEYNHIVQRNYSPKNIFTDKALMFSAIGFIKLSLPDSKIIYCTRNAKDHLLSIYKSSFNNNNHPYSYSMDDLTKYYNGYKSIMAHWKTIFEKDFYEISYENFINNPRIGIENLLNYCNLEWEDGCENFYENKRLVDTLSSSQVRKPIYSSSINFWKNYENQFRELFNRLN